MRGWQQVLCLMVLALVSLGCEQQDDVVRIMLWHQMRPGERTELRKAIDEFHAQNPQIRVRELYKENEELRSGFEASALAGVGPDLVFGPSDVIQVYQTMGIVQDLNPWFGPKELTEFVDSALTRLPAKLSDGQSSDRVELLQIGDRVGNHLALVYNRALIAEPPRTTDELVALAVANTSDENGDGTNDRYGLVWNYIEPFFVIPFVTGYGGWVFDEADPTRPNLDTPEAVAAFEFVLSLRDEHQAVPESCTYEIADALFKDGKAAMIINGDWSWKEYLEHDKIDAAVAPLPVVSATGLPMAPMVATKGYSLNANSRGQRAEAAITFVKFMVSAKIQEQMAVAAKTLPSRTALLESPALLADPTLKASAEQMKLGRPMPVVAELRAVWDSMRPHYQGILSGNVTASQAATAMQEDALRKVAQMNQDVRPGLSALPLKLLGWALGIGILIWQWPNVVELCRDFPRNRMAYLCVAPAMLLLAATVVFPFLFNIVLSFSNMSMKHFQEWEIVGVHNYLETFNEPQFANIFVKTIVWTVVNVFFHVVLGLLLAVALNGPVAGKRIYRILLIIPWAIPAYITALTWQGMFDYEYGAINLTLQALQIGKVNWLGDANLAFVACLVTNIWLGVPFMMIIALGGMQSIPQELYEAASIDRASAWNQFWHITLPMLKPVLLPAITLGVIWTFNKLDIVWLVSEGGKPEDQTHILVSYVYRAVFNLYRYGYGAALSMLIFGMLLLFSLVFLRKTQASETVH